MLDRSDAYSVRKILVEKNPGSHIEVGDHEWLLYVQNSCVKVPDRYCIQIGDTIYDPDIEFKICRIVVGNY